MKHSFCSEYDFLRIRPLYIEDIEFLRCWRNDAELSKYFTPIHEITPLMQERWYEAYLNDNDIITFTIEEIVKLKRIVGSVSLYGFHDGIAEIGKIVVGDLEARGKKIGYYAMLMALYLGIEKLNIKKFILSCHEDNIAALKNYKRIGFMECGRHKFIKGGFEIEMNLDSAVLQSTNSLLKEIYLYEENIDI